MVSSWQSNLASAGPAKSSRSTTTAGHPRKIPPTCLSLFLKFKTMPFSSVQFKPWPCLGEPCRDTPAPSPSRQGADTAPTAPEGGLAAPASPCPQPRWLTPSRALSCRLQVPAAVPGRGQGAATLPRCGGAARVGRPVGAAVAARAVHVPERQGPAHQHRSAPRGCHAPRRQGGGPRLPPQAGFTCAGWVTEPPFTHPV